VRAAHAQKLLVDELIEHVQAGGGIHVPQPTGLRDREP